MSRHVRTGDRIQIRGMWATIMLILPLGTVDVRTDDGRWYRVSGLEVTP